MVVIYCYLEGENYTVLKFHRYNSSYLKISTSLFYTPPSSKCHILKFQNWISAGALIRGNMVCYFHKCVILSHKCLIFFFKCYFNQFPAEIARSQRKKLSNAWSWTFSWKVITRCKTFLPMRLLSPFNLTWIQVLFKFAWKHN